MLQININTDREIIQLPVEHFEWIMEAEDNCGIRHFFTDYGDHFVGVDFSDCSESFDEEFDNREECIFWLQTDLTKYDLQERLQRNPHQPTPIKDKIDKVEYYPSRVHL